MSLLFLLSYVFFLGVSGSLTQDVVTLSFGNVIGLNDSDYQVRYFYNIPYALPPTGTRRYAPPEAWSGSYNNGSINGTYNANIMCPQPTNANSTIPSYMSEDCLFLNIFSPSRAYINANGSVPVMFFVHGGSFVAGSSSQYNGIGLAAREHVVVVAINYRLGPFGFLATSKLLSTYNTTGNWGLLDQRLALQWVSANIQNFGGDPTKVTLFGESAGAMSTFIHLAMLSEAGLFSQVIIESMAYNPVQALSTAETASSTFITNAGCGSAQDKLACMRALSVRKLINTTYYESHGMFLDSTWRPVIDGYEILQAPLDSIHDGNFNRIPIIMGTNKDEGNLFIYDGYDDSLSQIYYSLAVYFLLPDYYSEVLALYPPIDGDNRPQLSRVITESSFLCPTRQGLFWASKYVPTTTYGYRFYGAPNCTFSEQPLYGSFHSAELYYLFSVSTPSSCTFPAQDVAMLTTIKDLWGSFVNSGTPSSAWPNFRPAQSYYMINYTTSVLTNLSFVNCNFWDTVWGYPVLEDTVSDSSGSSSQARSWQSSSIQSSSLLSNISSILSSISSSYSASGSSHNNSGENCTDNYDYCLCMGQGGCWNDEVCYENSTVHICLQCTAGNWYMVSDYYPCGECDVCIEGVCMAQSCSESSSVEESTSSEDHVDSLNDAAFTVCSTTMIVVLCVVLLI